MWTAKAVSRWKVTGERPSTVMVWTPELAGRFLDYAEDNDPDLYPMFVLILHRGLRRGEAVGLPDANFDLDNAATVIDQQLATIGYTNTIIKKVKSDSGNRFFSLVKATLDTLRTYHAQRARWQLAAGAAWPDTGLFFVQRNGQPWHPDTITK